MFMNIPQLNQEKEEHLYIDKNIKYKLRNDLKIYEKKMVESTFIEILKKKQKNIFGCVCLHPKHEVSDFKNKFITPLLDKLSNSLNLFYPTLQHPLELQETLKHLLITSIITSLSILFLEA